MKSYIILFSLFILSVLTFQSCSDTKASSPDSNPSTPPRTVKVMPAQSIQYREAVKASGQLALAEEARLSFKTGGVIRKIHVREGQQVRAGQLLAEIETDEISARAQQAELGKAQGAISVENARLALQLAERDYRNAKGLYTDSVATLEQLENAEVQLDNARNQLKLAERAQSIQAQQEEVANYNLRHAKILAPADGTILKKMAEPNEVTNPGTPVLLFGSHSKAFVLRVSVTDKDVVHLNLGDPATVVFDAYPGRTFSGSIREIAGMADPYTGTFEVEVEVKPEAVALRSGFIGRVSIQSSEATPLISIPTDALKVADGQAGIVFTAVGNQAQQQKVDIYKLQGDQLLLRSGVNAGDQVITSGLGFLQDGTPIIIE